VRRLGCAALLSFAALLLGTAYMLSVAMRDPIVRRASIGLPDWPAGADPVRVALLTDVHVAGPDMPPSRLARIVAQVNRLQPDLVLFGGDFVSDKRVATRRYAGGEALAPLAALDAPLGVVAVLGNHDHWRSESEIVRALRRADVRILDNAATTLGPLSLGGVDDAFTGRADVLRTTPAMRRLKGARVLLSHSPDVAPGAPADVTLLLAGHTHCGQIRLPLVGALSYMSAYGDRFACGLTRHGPLRVVTSAGLGTSLLPLRLGADPDLWLFELGPQAPPAKQARSSGIKVRSSGDRKNDPEPLETAQETRDVRP
jgi:predicted MPP superfamily phosphohydrolase